MPSTLLSEVNKNNLNYKKITILKKPRNLYVNQQEFILIKILKLTHQHHLCSYRKLNKFSKGTNHLLDQLEEKEMTEPEIIMYKFLLKDLRTSHNLVVRCKMNFTKQKSYIIKHFQIKKWKM